MPDVILCVLCDLYGYFGVFTPTRHFDLQVQSDKTKYVGVYYYSARTCEHASMKKKPLKFNAVGSGAPDSFPLSTHLTEGRFVFQIRAINPFLSP